MKFSPAPAVLALAGLILSSLSPIATAVAPSPEPGMRYLPGQGTDWREEYAYTLGVQAYIFGYPWVYMPTLRWQWVTRHVNADTPYAPLNQFWHAPRLITAQYKDGGTMNNDTLYSLAWLDLSRGPVILSMPETGQRYYTMQFVGMNSDRFADIGLRTTGHAPGHYAVVGPGWTGTLPKGVVRLPTAPSNSVLIFGRTLITGAADLPAVQALQRQYRLTPLAQWGKPAQNQPENRAVWQPFDEKTDPLAHWKTMNRAMAENPPDARHAVLLKQFSDIGVGPGLDVDKLDPATRRGLVRAAREGWRLMQAAATGGHHMKTVGGGWRYSPRSFGLTSEADDLLVRGSLQSMIGITANTPEESIYLNTSKDGAGKPLQGGKRYIMHFAPDALPDVKAFWSLTLYGADRNFIDNPINRYSLGDRSPGLKRDADGGLTIYIQPDSPGRERESNWLPTSTAQPYYYAILRAYMPGPSLLTQSWVPPALVETGQ